MAEQEEYESQSLGWTTNKIILHHSSPNVSPKLMFVPSNYRGGVLPMDAVGLDFETYATRDLRRVGLDNYMSDPEFRPLIGSIVGENDTGDEWVMELDFITEPKRARPQLHDAVRQATAIVSHNVNFEWMVLQRLGIDVPLNKFIDSAVAARAAGADSALVNCVPQLLNGERKDAHGKTLIKQFCLPDSAGRFLAQDMHDRGVLQNNPEWAMFKTYCTQDARLARELVKYTHMYSPNEQAFEILTRRMNNLGWNVDIDAVKAMKARYMDNLQQLQDDFCDVHDPQRKLNFNSPKQLVEWCAARGVNAKSFDEQHVATMLTAVTKRLGSQTLSVAATDSLHQVQSLLLLKQAMGGSSLKKLDKILELVSEDGRLRNQYMHMGAPGSFRTTGKGVQMQNLPRITRVRNMDALYEPSDHWSNAELSDNLRQLFTATDPSGSLVVGDFKSVESRGLAYVAGAQWKLDAYRGGQDLYVVQAAKMFHTDYATVTKDQRQTGKVGELSCGYGAGPVAVRDFAKKMGVDMSPAESEELVQDWRGLNVETVDMWYRLDKALKRTLISGSLTELVFGSAVVQFRLHFTPDSLTEQHPGAKSIEMRFSQPGSLEFIRVFHGCYMDGTNVNYYKPSALSSGKLWSPTYMHPKTKKKVRHNLYGGKLTGILVQSLCREIFFHVMRDVQRWCDGQPGIELVGQFHDELVLDYNPRVSTLSLNEVEQQLEAMMSLGPMPAGLPLGAEVKSAYRYIK